MLVAAVSSDGEISPSSVATSGTDDALDGFGLLGDSEHAAMRAVEATNAKRARMASIESSFSDYYKTYAFAWLLAALKSGKARPAPCAVSESRCLGLAPSALLLVRPVPGVAPSPRRTTINTICLAAAKIRLAPVARPTSMALCAMASSRYCR